MVLLVLSADIVGVIWAVNSVHSEVRFEKETEAKESEPVNDSREAVTVGEEDELVLAQKERLYVQFESIWVEVMVGKVSRKEGKSK
jgi:hypothetical protein